jgi:hypothetical protein
LKKKVKFILGGAIAEGTGVQVESRLRTVVTA